ncbi:MAG: hypothetical protein ACLFN5_02515 [bacterium]
MRFVFRTIISFFLTFLLVLVILFFLVFDFSAPVFEETVLEKEEEQEHYYTLRKLFHDRGGEELGLAFSPREVSFFCERYLPGNRYRGLELVAVRVRGEDDKIRVKLAVRVFPGVYARLIASGRVEFDGENWEIKLSQVQLGQLPVSWFVPAQINPGWSAGLPERDIYLQSAALDGSGLRLRIHRGENAEFSLLELF